MTEKEEVRKPWRILQRMSGWRQEFIEDLSFRNTMLRMKNPKEGELPIVDGEWMISWYESLSATERYVVHIMGRVPCVWRGLDKFTEKHNVHS